MTPERWEKVGRLFHSALEREGDDRAAHLQQACAGDDALRQEVESLLAQGKTADGLLDDSALGKMAAEIVGKQDGRSLLGTNLGSYQILSLLGAGGMGEVYRSRDIRLDRDVALKVLPAGLLADEAARRRFRKEALALAKLNNPHIAVIYDVGEEAGVDYLVMECVPGQSLAEKLKSGALPGKEVASLGAQIAEALEEAHEHGVIHRDLKPGNIMVTPKGQAKVLDFGLAKLLRPMSDAMATESFSETQGVVGTLPYMAPEQLTGEPVDARTDLYALGAVLFEMAVGRRPFQEDSAPRLTDAILHQPPVSPRALSPRVSPELERIILKCLEKEPENRYQSAKEVQVDLRRLSTPATIPVPAKAQLWWRNRKAIGIAAIALITILVVAGLLYRFAGRSGAIDSVAVLPFVNASADPNTEYLSDGITESLIDSLSQVPNLAVMSRNSVFRYKGRETDAQAAGQALKVQAVLTGTVVQRGDSLSISAELIEVRNNRHLWGEQYNRKLLDILTVQEEISTEISEKLRFELTGEEKKRLTKRYTENVEAYQLYLQGRYYWNKKTPAGFNSGIEYFQKAIKADPNYAPAYAALANLYCNLANYNFALMPPKEAWANAKVAAGKALQIDDALASAHASLAIVAYQWEWDWSNAEKEFKRALELDPSSTSTYEPSPSSTYHWYSHYLMTMGRTQESFRAGRRALQLDPVDLAINAHQGWYYLWTRQYDQAIEPLQKTIEMDPSFPVGQWYLGLAYEQKGAFQDAIAQFQNCVRITAGRASMVALLGHAYAAANQRSEARAILQQLSALSKQEYVPSYPVAVIYAALDEKEEALAWLERAYDERDSWMDYLGLDPRLDGLRSDPRFADLLRRMNLQP
jgi:serine/threonine-protein kinase